MEISAVKLQTTTPITTPSAQSRQISAEKALEECFTFTKRGHHYDGVIDAFFQYKVGDCWLLSTLAALSTTPRGQKIIKESIKDNGNGKVTVTLKGANKSYTFQKKEIEDVQSRLVFGDNDVRVIELAFKEYQKEMAKELRVQGRQDVFFGDTFFRICDDYIEGNSCKYAFKILANTDSKYFSTPAEFKKDDKLYRDFLENPNKYAATIGTKSHAYTLISKNGKFYVVNPHVSVNIVPLEKSPFKDAFNGSGSTKNMHITIVNVDTIDDNLKISYEKTTKIVGFKRHNIFQKIISKFGQKQSVLSRDNSTISTTTYEKTNDYNTEVNTIWAKNLKQKNIVTIVRDKNNKVIKKTNTTYIIIKAPNTCTKIKETNIKKEPVTNLIVFEETNWNENGKKKNHIITKRDIRGNIVQKQERTWDKNEKIKNFTITNIDHNLHITTFDEKNWYENGQQKNHIITKKDGYHREIFKHKTEWDKNGKEIK